MSKPICSQCKRTFMPTTDLIHYEDTGMLCDMCLAHELGMLRCEDCGSVLHTWREGHNYLCAPCMLHHPERFTEHARAVIARLIRMRARKAGAA